MRHPEMCLRWSLRTPIQGDSLVLLPHVYAGTEQFARNGETGPINVRTFYSRGFAELWCRNLSAQGFLACLCACCSLDSLNG